MPALLYYKATKKIAQLSGDDRIKKYTNKNGRDNRQDASLHCISKQQGFFKNLCWDTIIPTNLVCVLFDPTIPTLL